LAIIVWIIICAYCYHENIRYRAQIYKEVLNEKE
jgi:hypothetical protein